MTSQRSIQFYMYYIQSTCNFFSTGGSQLYRMQMDVHLENESNCKWVGGMRVHQKRDCLSNFNLSTNRAMSNETRLIKGNTVKNVFNLSYLVFGVKFVENKKETTYDCVIRKHQILQTATNINMLIHLGCFQALLV